MKASNNFVKIKHPGSNKFTKHRFCKETDKLRNFFNNNKFSKVEDLRSTYGEALEDSLSAVLGFEKIKEVKCNSGDSKLEDSKQLKVKKGNKPNKSVLELEQSLHNVSKFLIFTLYYLLQKI